MQKTDTRNAGAVNHPSAEDWMEFLYGEMPVPRRRELGDHVDIDPRVQLGFPDGRRVKEDIRALLSQRGAGVAADRRGGGRLVESDAGQVVVEDADLSLR